MRFDRTHGKTARDLVMTLDAPELARIFTLYGEEKKSWFIACEIIKQRKIENIDTTYKLLEIIRSSSFDQKSPLRVFQALRIAVNEEFAHIEDSLHVALSLLRPGGTIMVITFHSLEDRLVKHLFAPYLEDTIDEVTGQIREKAKFKKGTKKPIEPTEKEIYENPRSRSAKLRIIERVA
jgi:16S rRNA (cytosine1402-N4)-methyltransferase